MTTKSMVAAALAALALSAAHGAFAVTPIPIPKQRSLATLGTGPRDSVSVTPIPIPKQRPQPGAFASGVQTPLPRRLRALSADGR